VDLKRLVVLGTQDGSCCVLCFLLGCSQPFYQQEDVGLPLRFGLADHNSLLKMLNILHSNHSIAL
jgi:hypothetical protein